jgi:acyl-CoA reductase-like NAD-dependent aldehyde dehydrogenase
MISLPCAQIFGPVLAVTRYGSDEEAVALANDSEFGLGGTVWTTDQERGLAIARQVRTGTIGINTYGLCLRRDGPWPLTRSTVRENPILGNTSTTLSPGIISP